MNQEHSSNVSPNGIAGAMQPHTRLLLRKASRFLRLAKQSGGREAEPNFERVKGVLTSWVNMLLMCGTAARAKSHRGAMLRLLPADKSARERPVRLIQKAKRRRS